MRKEIAMGKLNTAFSDGQRLGDLSAAQLAFAFPALAVGLGWHGLFPEKICAVWVLDYIFAFVFGIAFQYFTIVPMRQLGLLTGLWQALKIVVLTTQARCATPAI